MLLEQHSSAGPTYMGTSGPVSTYLPGARPPGKYPYLHWLLGGLLAGLALPILIPGCFSFCLIFVINFV